MPVPPDNPRDALANTALRRPRLALLLGLLLSVPCGLAHESLLRNIEVVTKAIEQAPEDAALYLQRAELHRLHRDWDAARFDLRQVASLSGDPTVTDLHVGLVSHEEGRPDRALEPLSRYLERYPRRAVAWISRARALAALGRPLDAAADYTRALQLRPTPELYLERAKTLAEAGDDYRGLALKGLDEGIAKLGPLPGFVHRGIDLELQLGDWDSALRRIDQATEGAPPNVSWLVCRAEILELARRPDEAVGAYEAAREAVLHLPEHRRRTPMNQELEARITAALRRLSVRFKP